MKVKLLVTLLAMLMAGGPALFAASAAKQLEKGKQLYAQEKDDEAMDYFIDVLVNGSRAEAEEANSYINLIHSRIGGIQDPIEVDVNFKEGEARRLQPGQDPAVLEAQQAVEQEVADAGLIYTTEQDALAMKGEAIAEEVAAQEQAAKEQGELLRQQAQEKALEMQEAAVADTEAAVASVQTSSTFTDLTSPAALKARQIYTSQKLESMKQAAVARLEKAKGVRVYFRNDLPDAIDIDSEVLFNGYKFRPEALSVLDDVYTLMALTQGAGYIILPPGSYTDNITLAGVRQAMALNSFLVHKGLSSGKLSYNMGLYDQEPPAKFANLEGVSIVFDFDAELPASLPQAVSVNKLPMLSMAVVPVSNKIDPAAGEAFAVDFSVIETEHPVDNWLFQVIQHAENDGYYVVRQLEGFSPVYHQIVWNGRKGIIGPELACGTYTMALTAVDVMGGKRTVRRQVNVDCTSQKKAEAAKTAKAQEISDDSLDYKTARLWTKPGRKMVAPVEPSVAEPVIEDPFAAAAPAAAEADIYAQQQTYTAPTAAGAQSYTQPVQSYTQQPADVQNPYAAQGVTNPYDMPYEDYAN